MHKNKNLQPTYCLRLTQEVVSCDADNSFARIFILPGTYNTFCSGGGNSIFNML